MARIDGFSPPPASVRPLPNTGHGGQCSCPSNIISSPRLLRYNQGMIGNSMSSKIGRCFPCGGCIHPEFMRRTPGFLKLMEAVFGIICQFLLLEFGSGFASRLGESYTEFLITVSYCLINTVLLMACYLFSKNTFLLIRSSIFETAFNLVACILYLASSTHLAYALNTTLYVEYTKVAFFQVFPALTAAYALGFVAGIVHAIDAYISYRFLQFGR